MQTRTSWENGTRTLLNLTLAHLSLGVDGSFICQLSGHLVFQATITSGIVYHRGRIYCPLSGPLRCHTCNGPITGNEGASFQDHLQSSIYLLQSF
ncbi:hypothetical protein ACHAW6_002875 [Cyclotella cf. meneghiniana]